MKRILLLGLVLLLAIPGVALAQSLNLDLGSTDQAGATSKLIQLTALVTVLTLAPSILVMMTAFTRIVIVLSLLRNALSVQSTPPNTVLIGLALFLTFFVMQPTLEKSWEQGILPLTKGQITEIDGMQRAAEPFRDFMADNVRMQDLNFFLNIGKMPEVKKADDAPWRAIVPAFLISELRRGFEMGFLIFLPFLVIDIVVGSVLMSLGMMMLPPSAVSLPFKLIFFVTIDGWRMVAGSLVQSFLTGH
jgi:flagellar biosynthetic protein FliP